MSAEQGKMRFIRKNGRIIPIRAKDPNKAQRIKNYEKHGDGANQQSRIDNKYDRKAQFGSANSKEGAVGAVVGAAVGLATAKFLKGGARLGTFLGGATGLGIGARIKAGRNRDKYAGQKENEYVAAFGIASDGSKPFYKKKRK